MSRHILHTNVRRSPYFDRTEAAGATEYMVYNHMYMPMSYGRKPLEDYSALTERVTLWDVGAERQTELAGPDAIAFADYLTTRSLDDMEPYQARYTLCCDETGQILCDPILITLEDRVWLSHGTVDLTLWAKGIALHGPFDVSVVEPDVAPLQIQGPNAPEVMRALVGAAIDELGRFRCMRARIAGNDVIVSRTGWSGGPGYEVYPLGTHGALGLWDAIVDAGTSYGMLITGPNAAKAVESGITDTSLATNQSLNPLELWQDYLIDLDKGEFMGRAALVSVRDAGVTRRQVGLLGTAEPLPRQETLWNVVDGDTVVGATRWTVFSPRLERSVSIAVVAVKYASPGTPLQLVHPEGRQQVHVTELPFVR